MAYKCDFQKEQEAVIPAISEASFAETWSFCGFFRPKTRKRFFARNYNTHQSPHVSFWSFSLWSVCSFFQKSCLYLNVFYIQLLDRHVWL